MNAANATTTAISQGLYLGRQMSWSAAREAVELILGTRWARRYPWAELVIPVFCRLETDPYGNPLDDFDVTTRAICRRKQAEEWARGSSNAVHMTPEIPAARIHMNFRLLSGSHVPALHLFEIGGDPTLIKRNHGGQVEHSFAFDSASRLRASRTDG
jgi:hypothetical protein